jgi:hypothetical protein
MRAEAIAEDLNVKTEQNIVELAVQGYLKHTPANYKLTVVAKMLTTLTGHPGELFTRPEAAADVTPRRPTVT